MSNLADHDSDQFKGGIMKLKINTISKEDCDLAFVEVPLTVLVYTGPGCEGDPELVNVTSPCLEPRDNQYIPIEEFKNKEGQNLADFIKDNLGSYVFKLAIQQAKDAARLQTKDYD